MGGQERTWVRPLRARSLAQARVRRRAGGERRRARAQSRPAWPPSACLYGRAPTASRTGPGAPAEGARAAPREGGRGGGGGKMRAQSPVRGGGAVGCPPSCLPLLTCVLGGVRTTPLPPRRGEGPLLAAAFAAFKFPWGPRLLPPPCFHCFLSRHRDAGGGWEKWETLLAANRHRRFRGLTKMAAAVSAATTNTTATTTAHYRYRRRGPSSRERQ